MEARRWQDPVFRELYTEKRVVAEERRLRLDASPAGRVQRAYASAALSNNYRRPVIGSESDVGRLGRHEIIDFFNCYYGPTNLTISIVGDATPEQVFTLSERYFGGWQPADGYTKLPSGAALAEAAATEPLPVPRDVAATLDAGGRSLRQMSEAGPLVMLGFYRPALLGHEGVPLEVACELLTGSRTSRLTAELVLKRRSLLALQLDPAYGGEKHAGLAVAFARPANGLSPEAAGQLLRSELDGFLQSGPTPKELDRVKRASMAGLYSALQSNLGMANVLAEYHAYTGSWRGLQHELSAVDALRGDDVVKAARTYLGADNCFAGYVETLPSAVPVPVPTGVPEA